MTRAALKAQNVGGIWAVVVADAVALAAFAYPWTMDQAPPLAALAPRIGGAAIAPVMVLLLTSLLPSDVKATLVFWRVSDALPGHRAFSYYAPKDPRIDLERLRAVVGDFPKSPRDQNTLWYRLFKSTDGEPAVAQAHRHFLLFRDLASLSLLLGVLAAGALIFVGTAAISAGIAIALFGIQYLATALAARLHGERLVCNVLAHVAAGGAPKPATTRSRRKDAGAPTASR